MGSSNSSKTDNTPKVLPAAQPAVDDYYKLVQAYAGNVDPSSSVPNLNQNLLSAWGGASTLGVGGTPNYSMYYGGAPTTTTIPTTSGATPLPTAMGGGAYSASSPTPNALSYAPGTANPNSLAGKLGVTPSSYSGNTVADDLKTEKPSVASNLDLAANLFGDDFKDPFNSALKKSTGVDPFDPAGIFNGLTRKPATTAYDVFGTPTDNAQHAGDADWTALYKSAGLSDWGDNLKTDDPRGYALLSESYDLDNSGDLSPGELAQAWYYSIAPASDPRGFKGGGKVPTPAESYAAAQAAGAGQTAGTGNETITPVQQATSGTAIGPIGASSAPALSSNDLNQQALAAIQKAMGTTLTPRTYQDVLGNPDLMALYTQPFQDQIDAYDAAAQDRLAQQIAQNQSRATLASAYGGSRHGVADAELERTSLLDQNLNDANLRAAALQQALGLAGSDNSSLYNADVANLQNIYTGAQDLSTLGVTADANTRANVLTQAQMGQLEQAWDLAIRNGDFATLQKIQQLLSSTPVGSNVDQSTPSNPGAAALGGAGTGATVGSYFGPWGTLIGAAGGALAGYASAS